MESIPEEAESKQPGKDRGKVERKRLRERNHDETGGEQPGTD